MQTVNQICFDILLFQKFNSGWDRLSYVIKLYAAFGMKANGTKTCGDYVFSGHTAIITLLVLSLNECKYFRWLS